MEFEEDTEDINDDKIDLERVFNQPVIPYACVDYISCLSTDKSRPQDTLNPQVTLENAQDFLDSVLKPMGYKTGIHVQAGYLNPPSVVIDKANKMELDIYSGDIAYLENPIKTLIGVARHPSPVESAGYSAMQVLPSWFPSLQTKSITTMISGTLPVGEKRIIRACTQLIDNGQIDDVIELIKSLGKNIILALEINTQFHSAQEYLKIIRNMANQGKPVGISFDTAGMATAASKGREGIDLGSIKREYEKILINKDLMELLYCIEIDPISESGERHADIGNLQGYIDGMIGDWKNSPHPHNIPHFVVETHPRDLEKFLNNPFGIRRVLADL